MGIFNTDTVMQFSLIDTELVMVMNFHTTLQVIASVLLASVLLLITIRVNAQTTTGLQPSPSAVQVTSAGSRQAIAEKFLDLVFRQNYDAAVMLLHPSLRRDWTPQRLQQDTEEFLKRTGPFLKRLNSKVDGNVVLVKTEFDKVTDDIFVIFDDTGSQITGVDFPKDPTPTVPYCR